MKYFALKLTLILAISLSSAQSQAVAYSGTWTQNKNNEGQAWTEMRNKNTHFCYLSKVQFEETDTDGEWARCRVWRGTNSWFLEAKLGKSQNADAFCSATCYSN
jgi:hypothetical protein